MKALVASLFALGLVTAVAADAPAMAAPASGKAAVVVKVGGGGHHRRHVCGGWGYRNHARFCRRWYWR